MYRIDKGNSRRHAEISAAFPGHGLFPSLNVSRHVNTDINIGR